MSGSQSSDLTKFSHADLGVMKKLVLDNPCSCGPRGRMTDVRDTDGRLLARQCSRCGEVKGVDDSMDMNDFTRLLHIGDVKTKACVECGNDDPFRMIFQDHGNGLLLVCDECQYEFPIPLTKQSESESSSAEQRNENDLMNQSEDINLTCEECFNTSAELFQVGIDDHRQEVSFIKCLVCEQNTNFSNSSISLVQCDCGNEDEYQFEPFFNQVGVVHSIRCNKCKHSQVIDQDNEATRQANAKKCIPIHSRIHNAQLLTRGDHIAWHRSAYWHHAIVVQGPVDNNNMVEVIHYTDVKGGPQSTSVNVPHGEIHQEWIEINGLKEEVYRVDYDDDLSYPPDVVIEKARNRLGEKRYNLLTRNCEHFARWSKVGSHSSLQVQSLKGWLLKYGSQLTSWLTVAMASHFAKSVLRPTLSTDLKRVARCIPIASEAVLCGALATVELFCLGKDIKQGYDQFMEIDGNEFAKLSISSGTKCLCTVLGSVAGGLIGTAITVAPIGAFIGRTVGCLLGHFLGGVISRGMEKIIDLQVCANLQVQGTTHILPSYSKFIQTARFCL